MLISYFTIAVEKQMVFYIAKWRGWFRFPRQEQPLKLNEKKTTGELRAVEKKLHASTSKLATLHLQIRE